jgi:CRP/FNR family transcriptional regulator, cyclic AMP receptor protein
MHQRTARRRAGKGPEVIVAKLERDAKRAALLGSPIFQAMQPEELDGILRLSSERHASRGTVIFQKGDAGSSLMAVLRGRVRVSSISSEGREVTLNVISPGEIFGEIALLDAKPRSADATAIEDTLLLIVERRQFLPFLRQNDDLYLRLLSMLCDRLRRTSLALEELAMFDLPARMARLLIKLGADYGRPGPKGLRIDLKLSQRDISTLVASSRESVNKQLRAWRETGVVDVESGYIVLRRPEQLKLLVES